MAGGFKELKKIINVEKQVARELSELVSYSKRTQGVEEKRMIFSQINALKRTLGKTDRRLKRELAKIVVPKKLKKVKEELPVPQGPEAAPPVKKEFELKIPKKSFWSRGPKGLSEIELKTLSRLKKKEKKEEKKKVRKPSLYVKLANKLFSKFALSSIEKGGFKDLKRDLVRGNIRMLPASYVSVILFTSLLSFIVGFFIMIFLLVFTLSLKLPIISFATGSMLGRLLKVFWVPLVLPIGTFLFMYLYPSMEKKAQEGKINFELPFVAIHMSAISGALIEPSRVFSIIVSTGEYPNIGKEFTKLLNEVNIYGADLVGALRSIAFNSPSAKLSELLNGVATTITSGGDLRNFFEKRSQSLLFEHRLEREKYTKTAETFMDLYISVVIAAPMILMLLVMVMKISGLGVQLSTGAITTIMVLAVGGVNILFLMFLQLKQPPV